MCWPHTVPNSYIENITSHWHPIIRTRSKTNLKYLAPTWNEKFCLRLISFFPPKSKFVRISSLIDHRKFPFFGVVPKNSVRDWIFNFYFPENEMFNAFSTLWFLSGWQIFSKIDRFIILWFILWGSGCCTLLMCQKVAGSNTSGCWFFYLLFPLLNY